MTTLDPVAYKESTRLHWQNVAEAWDRWESTIREWLGPATEVLLDLACIGPGSRVLDVAAGAGEPALTAAERVGPSGYVVATDISSNILAFAARAAEARGLGEVVETCVMDGENLELPDGSFDAVLSRLGLIYFPNRQRALAEMHRVVRLGGRVAFVTYGTPEANGFFSVPVSIIRRRAQQPQPMPGQPGPFSMATQGAIEEALDGAGFREIEVRVVPSPLRLDSAAQCLAFAREAFGALHQMLAGLPETEQDAAWAEVGEALRQFDGPGGFEGPCQLLVGAGTK